MREHPQLFLPRNEVVYFEDPGYSSRDPTLFHRLFSPAAPGQHCGFKRPELLARPECPLRVVRDLPDVRLVAVLREPLARTVSAYFHYMRAGVIPVVPLNVGLRQILRGEIDAQFPMAQEVVNYSLYGQHLQRYLNLFERDAVMVLLDEDFRQNATGTLRQVYSFLGVRPDFVPESVTARANTGVYALTRIRLLRQGSRFVYRYRRGSSFVDLREDWLARGAYRAVGWVDRVGLAPFFRNAPPELDNDVRSELAELFADDLDQLEGILRRPLELWRRALN